MAQDQAFEGRQVTSEVILWAVRWYLMFPISYRDQQNPGFEEFGGGMFAFVDHRFKCVTLFRAQPDDVFLDRDFWHGSIPYDVVITLPEIHKLLS